MEHINCRCYSEGKQERRGKENTSDNQWSQTLSQVKEGGLTYIKDIEILEFSQNVKSIQRYLN